MDEIVSELKDKGILIGHTYVFRPPEAISLINKCRQMNRNILGIDVFKISEKGNQIVDYIDYSSGEFKTNNVQDIGFWDEAEQYIMNRINTDYLFEIVYS